MTHATEMIRPFWKEPARPDLDDITVLICQNKTPDLIRLCLTSLLAFYPTIKILIVNGTPDDEAGRWIKYKAAKHSNVTVWDRVGYDSHGVAMDDAIEMKINTRYVLTLDSDVIIKRGGWIEDMKRFFHMAQYATPDTLFAVGALMEVTRKGDACGAPEDKTDILRYIHPHCGMYDRNIYKELEARFTDHGAPCVYTMKAAEEKGFRVEGFPVADYIMHLSGASWTDPRTVWSYDNEVMVRPLVSFVGQYPIAQEGDSDYDVVPMDHVLSSGNFVIHGKEPALVCNQLFKERMKVTGDYVCIDKNVDDPKIVAMLRNAITTQPGAAQENEIVISFPFAGRKFAFYTRKYYQEIIAWQ